MAVSMRTSVRTHGGKVLRSQLAKVVTNHKAVAKEFVTESVRIAAEFTPRWSGAATLGWRFNPTNAGANANYINTFQPLKYEMGISDSGSAALVNKVVSQHNVMIDSFTKRLVKDGSFNGYLFNQYAYAADWLSSRSAEEWLRDVNHDFLTMAEIRSEIKKLRNRLRSIGG